MKEELKRLALQAGFDECRVARADRAVHADAFFRWLAAGKHADMLWLARNPERRVAPSAVLPGCRSLVVLAASYYQGDGDTRNDFRVARYAWGEDYHHVLADKLKQVEDFLAERGGRQKSYIDTGPVLERDYAAKSGLAWQGKSTMALNRNLGTWFFLSVILTTLELDPDPAAKNYCGSCTRCIDSCPTQAITMPYHLDARRCLSYQTIENKGSIPLEFRRALGARIYGCDDCLEACPWNHFARQAREERFQMLPILREKSLVALAQISADEFRSAFRHSPIKRLTHRRFVRNICVALGNMGTAADLPVLRSLAGQGDSLLAEHADWAICEIEARAAVRTAT
jgi:epoxyqueuosine reductase